MRLFVAASLDERMKRYISGIQDELRAEGAECRHVGKEELHITLAFIGEHPDPDEVMDVIREVSFHPVSIRAGDIIRKKDILMLRFSESRELSDLSEKIRKSLSGHGIDFDIKSFMPHVTIARGLKGGPVHTDISKDITMTVNRFGLYRSERGKGHMVYTLLGSVPAE